MLSAQEHKPDFVRVQGKAQHNERIAKEYLKNELIPWTQGDSAGKTIYLKMSHMFGHGFVEPLIELKVPFEALFVYRDTREVALSMWRMGYVPVRWFRTDDYFLRPECKYNVYRIEPKIYTGWSDYQLCYWHTLEMEGRARKYKQMFSDRDILYYETTYPDFVDIDNFLHLAHKMNLGEIDAARYEEVQKKGKINATYSGVRDRTFAEIDSHEQAVREAISEHTKKLGGLHVYGGAV